MALPGRLVALSLALIAVTVLLVAELLTGAGGREPRSGQQAPTPSPSASQDAQPAEPTAQPLLVPNLRSLRAEDLSVQETPDGLELRFAAWLANVGPGPLLLRPRPPSPGCPRDHHPAVQIVHRDKGGDGTYRLGLDQPVRRRFAGCMLIHADHDHWHFDAMASYVLRDPATDEVLAARPKVSFCLRDNRRVRGVPTRVRREYFGECSRTTRQGISPGWIDVYSADLPDQSLPLPPGRRPHSSASTSPPTRAGWLQRPTRTTTARRSASGSPAWTYGALLAPAADARPRTPRTPAPSAASSRGLTSARPCRDPRVRNPRLTAGCWCP